jgi:hypothetical protein
MLQLTQTGESFMPQDESTAGPSGLRIERPLCPNCQTSMALARIMPGIPGFRPSAGIVAKSSKKRSLLTPRSSRMISAGFSSD